MCAHILVYVSECLCVGMHVYATYQFSTLIEINGQHICNPMDLLVRVRGLLNLNLFSIEKKKN